MTESVFTSEQLVRVATFSLFLHWSLTLTGCSRTANLWTAGVCRGCLTLDGKVVSSNHWGRPTQGRILSLNS